MRPIETAIVLQGFQKEFCDPAGALYPLVEEQLRLRRTVENTLELLEGARRLGVRVYCVPIVFSPDYRELRGPTGILAAIRDRGAFRKGTPGVELIEAVAPYVDPARLLPPKRGLCAFGSTDLAAVLRADGIETVALCGLLTNVCVESTGRSAYDLGFRVVFVGDCTAGKSDEEQAASERFVFPLIGEVMGFRRLLAEMAGARAAGSTRHGS